MKWLEKLILKSGRRGEWMSVEELKTRSGNELNQNPLYNHSKEDRGRKQCY